MLENEVLKMDLERGKSVSVGPKTIKGCLTTTPNQTLLTLNLILL